MKQVRPWNYVQVCQYMHFEPMRISISPFSYYRSFPLTSLVFSAAWISSAYSCMQPRVFSKTFAAIHWFATVNASSLLRWQRWIQMLWKKQTARMCNQLLSWRTSFGWVGGGEGEKGGEEMRQTQPQASYLLFPTSSGIGSIVSPTPLCYLSDWYYSLKILIPFTFWYYSLKIWLVA